MKPSDVLYGIAVGSKRRQRLLAPIGLIIFILFLSAVVLGGLATDRAFAPPPLFPGPVGVGLGVLLIIPGAILWSWCVVLFWRAHGTPVPFHPPRTLVTSGPFRYVRNPIVVGVVSCLFGLGFVLHSASLVFLWLPAFFLVNAIELKYVEESELERRFGETYNAYRRRVPRFLPRIGRRENDGTVA
jgi:protein-S-isoprenylcysteine O-methyltransferase Ste14